MKDWSPAAMLFVVWLVAFAAVVIGFKILALVFAVIASYQIGSRKSKK